MFRQAGRRQNNRAARIDYHGNQVARAIVSNPSGLSRPRATADGYTAAVVQRTLFAAVGSLYHGALVRAAVARPASHQSSPA